MLCMISSLPTHRGQIGKVSNSSFANKFIPMVSRDRNSLPAFLLLLLSSHLFVNARSVKIYHDAMFRQDASSWYGTFNLNSRKKRTYAQQLYSMRCINLINANISLWLSTIPLESFFSLAFLHSLITFHFNFLYISPLYIFSVFEFPLFFNRIQNFILFQGFYFYFYLLYYIYKPENFYSGFN